MTKLKLEQEKTCTVCGSTHIIQKAYLRHPQGWITYSYRCKNHEVEEFDLGHFDSVFKSIEKYNIKRKS